MVKARGKIGTTATRLWEEVKDGLRWCVRHKFGVMEYKRWRIHHKGKYESLSRYKSRAARRSVLQETVNVNSSVTIHMIGNDKYEMNEKRETPKHVCDTYEVTKQVKAPPAENLMDNT